MPVDVNHKYFYWMHIQCVIYHVGLCLAILERH